MRKIPPFPPIAARLLSLLSNPAVEMDDVADLIGSDARFTARLLQCVNSAEFGLAHPVRNVRQAVSLLGLDRTREITLTQATAAYMKGASQSAELRRCWQHTIATAVLADEIAQSCGAFVNVAFTAGMIHDIGRFGLVVAYPREYERIIRNAAELCLDLLDFEREEFGVDHAEAGRFLAEEWGLPQEFRVITGRHHDPSEGAELDLLRIVHIACRLADVLGYDVAHPLGRASVDAVLAELPARARERLQASPEQLCRRIDRRILEYDSDAEEPAPEPDPVAEAAPTEIETEPEPP
ncbi:MAG TPA: HDOD domain-containing protein, partial [Bryobacteraceae bacterium]|nr:HDOD domain-containing protein [Bryobacteraceae bacterium]